MIKASGKELKAEGFAGPELTFEALGGTAASATKLIIKKSPGLKSIKAGVFPKLPALTSLQLEKTGIEALPDDIGQCAALEEIVVLGGALRWLPASLAKLPRLKRLTVVDCGLVALPAELGTAPALKDVTAVAGNLLVQPPVYVANKGTDAVKKYLVQLQKVAAGKKPDERVALTSFGPFVTDDAVGKKATLGGPETPFWAAGKAEAVLVPETSVDQWQGKRPYQEDRVSQEVVPLQGGGHALVYGVYDGHAGAQCADFLTANLHKILAAQPTFKPDTLDAALKAAYAAAEAQFLAWARKENCKAGSTALTVVLAGGRMAVAFVGDCAATLVSGNQAARLTKDHTCKDPDERRRVESVGGKVVMSEDGSVRVNGKIVTTRAFGDIGLKEPTPFLTAEPDIRLHTLTPRDTWLILGSDGMWDFVADHDAREFCQKYGNPKEVGERLMKRSKDANGRDNSTSLVIQLHWLVGPVRP